MELNVPERVELLQLIPQQGGYADIQEYRKLRNVLILQASDLEAIGYDSATEKYDIPKAAQWIVDIPMGEWVTNAIRAILIKIEKDKRLTEQNISLYEKFVHE